MAKTLYLQGNTGISGDMFVAALLDLGADETVLRKALDSLPVDGFTYTVHRVKKAGLDMCDFLVELDAQHANHDHDMNYLYGHEHQEGHCHQRHEHGHKHCEHHHEHGEEVAHSHSHRGLAEILTIIEGAALTAKAKALAEKIFQIIAEAEAQAHGLAVNEVHFHEVGAVDSIVDIVAAAVCFDNLDIDQVILPQLCEGSGSVRCQHGILPIPVPAVANIAAAYGLPLMLTQQQGELVTPTGAAIAAAITTDFQLPCSLQIMKVGMGAGKRAYEQPSFLRAMFIKPLQENEAAIVELQSNIDDSTGEILGYTLEKLLAAGALDVFYTPVYMKKNRPAYLLTVLCQEENVAALEQIIFSETTTIGVRRCHKERTCLERSAISVKLSIGSLAAKECVLPDGSHRFYPEYKDAVRLAQTSGLTLQAVYDLFRKEV